MGSARATPGLVPAKIVPESRADKRLVPRPGDPRKRPNRSRREATRKNPVSLALGGYCEYSFIQIL